MKLMHHAGNKQGKRGPIPSPNHCFPTSEVFLPYKPLCGVLMSVQGTKVSDRAPKTVPRGVMAVAQAFGNALLASSNNCISPSRCSHPDVPSPFSHVTGAYLGFGVTACFGFPARGCCSAVGGAQRLTDV